METTIDAFTAYEQELNEAIAAEAADNIEASEAYMEEAAAREGVRVTPDISLYSKMEVDLTRDQVRATEPPLLAVEIESPTQSTQDLVDEARAMIEAGVASCWIVQPSLQTVTLLDAELRPRTFTEGSFEDPATGIEIDVEKVFASVQG